MTDTNITVGLGLTYLILVLFLVIGWFMNVFAVIADATGEITAFFILRLAGVFVPFLGGILGWF